jgi:hypothetical protein
MGQGGEAEKQRKQVGVSAMKPEEFRRWFFQTMKKRERAVVEEMVRSKVGLSSLCVSRVGGAWRWTALCAVWLSEVWFWTNA